MPALANLITGGLVLIVVQLAVTVSNLIMGAAGAILSWVLSPNFINLPYTKEGIVGIGWELVRDFTNMFFIIILVFIGLSTALRIRDYEAKKTLPLLIIIAILINFTPVICGAIIDAANIVMHFFLEKLTGTNPLEAQLIKEWVTLKGGLEGLTTLNPFYQINPANQVSIVLEGLVLFWFNIIAAFIFFAFSFLFIVRYIAIWVLVILSPLAFFSYILPATRRVWTMWWNQFIQWATIGITGAFFLYLGLQSLTILSDTKIYSTPPPPNLGLLEEAGINFINEMLPYGVAIAFLLLAFFMGLSTGAMGGSQILNLAKKGGAATAKWTGKTTGGAIRGIPAVSRAEGAVRRRMESIPALRGMVGGAGAYDAGLNKKRNELGKNLESMSTENLHNFIQQGAPRRDDKIKRARGVEILAERHALTNADQGRINEAIGFGADRNKIYNNVPYLAGGTNGNNPIGYPLPVAGAAEAIQQQVGRMSVGDFAKNVSHLAFQNAAGGHSQEHLEVLYGMDRRKAINLGEKGNFEQRRAVRSLVDNNLTEIVNRVTNLRATGRPADGAQANRIEAILYEVGGNPNFVV